MFPFLLLPNELRVQIVDCLDVSTRLKCLKVNKILRENLGVIGLLPSQLESIAIDCKLYGKLIIRLIDTNFSSIQLHRSAIYEAFEDSPQFEVKFDGDKDIYCFPINLAEIILEKWEDRARAKTLTISAEEAFVETVDNIGIRRTTYLAYADNLEIHFKFLPVLEKCANSLLKSFGLHILKISIKMMIFRSLSPFSKF
ncbi:unnamed protein product, partial [Mesorhabditis belari]|uniref:F-box domain-containing protein n=1 Tax=Mesorhabditis belari TaxID=2138241 RepID=A0AAF3JB36_9BILA